MTLGDEVVVEVVLPITYVEEWRSQRQVGKMQVTSRVVSNGHCVDLMRLAILRIPVCSLPLVVARRERLARLLGVVRWQSTVLHCAEVRARHRQAVVVNEVVSAAV